MFLDPMNDCPDKLIWALCGYLAWKDDAPTYEEALRELKELLDYTLDGIEIQKKQKAEEDQPSRESV